MVHMHLASHFDFAIVGLVSTESLQSRLIFLSFGVRQDTLSVAKVNEMELFIGFRAYL